MERSMKIKASRTTPTKRLTIPATTEASNAPEKKAKTKVKVEKYKRKPRPVTG